LSYETIGLEEGQVVIRQSDKKGLLPIVVDRFLKRRSYFKGLVKELPKDSLRSLWCEQRINSLKNILVCLYGSTGLVWNRCGNVLAFEEINKISRDVLIKTKDIVQQLGYELVYADTDSVFIKRKDNHDITKRDSEELIDVLSKEAGLPIFIDCQYKFLVLLPLESDEN
jgi:DNA polymerase elongation subunit (family B)